MKNFRKFFQFFKKIGKFFIFFKNLINITTVIRNLFDCVIWKSSAVIDKGNYRLIDFWTSRFLIEIFFKNRQKPAKKYRYLQNLNLIGESSNLQPFKNSNFQVTGFREFLSIFDPKNRLLSKLEFFYRLRSINSTNYLKLPKVNKSNSFWIINDFCDNKLKDKNNQLINFNL